jgi:adenine-specific DNA-methyltransferase
MMYERIVLLNELLSNHGSIYVHCDTRANSSLRFLLDEVFGPQAFRNEIRWIRSLPKNDPGQFGRSSDSILYYTKSDDRTFNPQYLPQKEESVKAHYREDDNGRFYQLASLLAPGGRGPLYEYQGFERNWRFTKEKMLALEQPRNGNVLTGALTNSRAPCAIGLRSAPPGWGGLERR